MKRSGLNDPASEKLSSETCAIRILEYHCGVFRKTQSPNRIASWCAAWCLREPTGCAALPRWWPAACRSAGVDFLSQPRQQRRMPAQPLHAPGQSCARCLMTGGHQCQQLVGDMPIRDRLTVVVAGLDQQREHVAALFEGRVGPRIGDEGVDHSVESAPVPQKPPPRTPRTQISPQFRRQHGEAPTIETSGGSSPRSSSSAGPRRRKRHAGSR